MLSFFLTSFKLRQQCWPKMNICQHLIYYYTFKAMNFVPIKGKLSYQSMSPKTISPISMTVIESTTLEG